MTSTSNLTLMSKIADRAIDSQIASPDPDKEPVMIDLHCNTVPTVTEESGRILFGQSAATVPGRG